MIHLLLSSRKIWTQRLVAACLLVLPPGGLAAKAGAIPAVGNLRMAVVDAIPLHLDQGARQKLMASGNYSSYFEEQPAVDLCPSPAAAADIIRTLNAAHPNVGVQTLVVAPMPAGLAARADRNLVLYNLIHQFRTMEGLQYFSATHGEIRTLFTTSHVVAAAGGGTLLSDPHFLTIERTHSFLLEQDDSTFGKNLYAVTVGALDGGTVQLTMSNVEKVWYGFIPVLKPGALHLTMVIQPSADGNYLYFYGNVGVTVTKAFGLEEKVRTSFYNRVMALYAWYAKQAARA
jgi:hypothetical protein